MDATNKTGFARLVNDGTGPSINCAMKIVVIQTVPHQCLFFTRTIEKGEELRYDCGGYICPWRKQFTFYIQIVLYSNFLFVTKTGYQKIKLVIS